MPGVRYPNEHLVRFMTDWKNSSAYPKDRKPHVLEFCFVTISSIVMIARFGYDVDGLEMPANTAKRTSKAITHFGKEDAFSVDTYEGGVIIPKSDSYYNTIVGLQCVYYNLDSYNKRKSYR